MRKIALTSVLAGALMAGCSQVDQQPETSVQKPLDMETLLSSESITRIEKTDINGSLDTYVDNHYVAYGQPAIVLQYGEGNDLSRNAAEVLSAWSVKYPGMFTFLAIRSQGSDEPSFSRYARQADGSTLMSALPGAPKDREWVEQYIEGAQWWLFNELGERR